MAKTIEDVLTAAEKRAVKKNVRSQLVASVDNELRSVVRAEARRMLKDELKLARDDKAFMKSVRDKVRKSIVDAASRTGASLSISGIEYFDY